MNAGKFLTKDDIETIEKQIAEAEKLTSAEIVCALATESGRYDRSESIIGLILGVAGLGVAEVFNNRVFTAEGYWGIRQGITIGWQVLAVTLGFVAGSGIATYFHPIRKLVTANREMEEEVARAATYVFSRAKLTSTKMRTGLLLYVSLFERKVLVLADKTTMEVLGQKGLDELRDIAVGHLKKNERVKTFTETVAKAAEMLKETLPPDKENPDELPNTLLIFDPRP